MKSETEVSMMESEGTQSDSSSSGGSTSSSGGSATRPRKRSTGALRKTATATRRKTATRKKTGTGARKTAPRRRRRASTKEVGLQSFLNDLAKRANRAGSTIADLSEKGADAARGTIGKVSTSSRKTIARVRREWDRLDNARKAQFVAGLLAALAATAAGVAKASRK
jgi:hypothetical protein